MKIWSAKPIPGEKLWSVYLSVNITKLRSQEGIYRIIDSHQWIFEFHPDEFWYHYPSHITHAFEILVILDIKHYWYYSLREKCPNTEFFLVRIFLYSDWIQENTDQKKLHIWTLFAQWKEIKEITYLKEKEITYLKEINLSLFTIWTFINWL